MPFVSKQAISSYFVDCGSTLDSCLNDVCDGSHHLVISIPFEAPFRKTGDSTASSVMPGVPAKHHV